MIDDPPIGPRAAVRTAGPGTPRQAEHRFPPALDQSGADTMQPMNRNPRRGRTVTSRRRRLSRRPVLEPLEGRVVLSHFYTVTGTADSTDSAIHGGAGTVGSPFQMASLRGAIIATNGDAGSTITLPAATYTLALHRTQHQQHGGPGSPSPPG